MQTQYTEVEFTITKGNRKFMTNAEDMDGIVMIRISVNYKGFSHTVIIKGLSTFPI